MTDARKMDAASLVGRQRPDGVALRHAIRHLQVSTGVRMDADAMIEAFTTGNASGAVLDAVEAHLREAEPAEVADLVIEGSATISGLRRLAVLTLPEGHRIRAYLDRFEP